MEISAKGGEAAGDGPGLLSKLVKVSFKDTGPEQHPDEAHIELAGADAARDLIGEVGSKAVNISVKRNEG